MIVRCTSRAARIWCGGGDIDGISVKFSDFYAAKKVKSKRSCYFKACFLRPILIKIKLYNANRTREFAKLAIYGKKANMDDARFEEILSLYDRSDRCQIRA